MAKELSDYEKDELASDARMLSQSKAMAFIFDRLEKQYVERLKAANIGALTVPTLHASMKVLEDVKNEIQTLIADAQFKRIKG